MRILKGIECRSCGSERIAVIPFREDGTVVVSHGECTECFKSITLPQEEFRSFVAEFC